MREILAFIVFVIVTGACVDGAIVAYQQVHGSPFLATIGCYIGLGLGLVLASGIAKKPKRFRG